MPVSSASDDASFITGEELTVDGGMCGSNSGIRYEAALELGRAGATVIVAVRDPKRGEEAAERIRKEAAGAEVEVMELDLASLSSVATFAEGSRVVNVASAAHNWGSIDFEDLQWERKKHKKAKSYGPGGFMEMRGYPKRVRSNDASRDQAVAARLWDVSEELSGVRFDRLQAGRGAQAGS